MHTIKPFLRFDICLGVFIQSCNGSMYIYNQQGRSCELYALNRAKKRNLDCSQCKENVDRRDKNLKKHANSKEHRHP
ncbi:hypothetical protein CDAR_588711 [Caerostris darwini]|uniref:C2H2-type domain-containing protein n=1 Tax=Caerostris darwini TaxID=1538125 RepID=A0AAV4UVC6_9ARAC|nr:hypothetical protein CDAR_588711 [Caerostris darwini]